ncbi:MAG: bifunctional aldolase/short-chain dehydrogenase [Nitrospinae bacterium]|nr:bifunctional aldolase/short-chain dehydrogenase [Nitrospinota bacterium]
MLNRWNDNDAREAVKKYASCSEDVALRVYTSRLIGSDPALVLHGGGNTSVKSLARNRVGEEIRVLYVKGSGWDLDTLEPPGLPGVRLDNLLKLRALDRLSDEDMVNEQRINLLDASAPNPSVETLLHAFLPHKFIDHSHADAILSIANQPGAERLCKEIFGDMLGFVPYIMPGFALAKAAAEIYEKNPRVKGLLLVNHGLFTFAETARESYDYHIEAVSHAESYIASKPRRPLTLVQPPRATAGREEILRAIAPVLRGLYHERSGESWVVHYRKSDPAYAFASSRECAEWSQIGPATPDHVIRTKQKPLLLDPASLDDPRKLREELSAALDRYGEAYRSYFKANKEAKGTGKKELDPLPRIILVAGLGLVAVARTVKDARIAADIYEHTIEIVQDAFAVGKYVPLDDGNLFDMEYWSLEQAKLGKSKPPKLQGKVVYVTGAASGIGLATARLFAQHGANLFLADRDREKLQAAREKILGETKTAAVVHVVDVTDEKAVKESFDHLAEEYGGLDILVSNAGNAVQGRIGEVDAAVLRKSFDLNFFAHQTLASLAVKMFLTQKCGGVLLFNASKAAFNPGKDFGPYALPKAAVVALTKQYALDYGKDGIRANALNADRVRTGLFAGNVVAERAAARGLNPDEYFKDNLLGREVYDMDVAEGFLHLALAEKTTGSVIVVDGGNIAASPR